MIRTKKDDAYLRFLKAVTLCDVSNQIQNGAPFDAYNLICEEIFHKAMFFLKKNIASFSEEDFEENIVEKLILGCNIFFNTRKENKLLRKIMLSNYNDFSFCEGKIYKLKNFAGKNNKIWIEDAVIIEDDFVLCIKRENFDIFFLHKENVLRMSFLNEQEVGQLSWFFEKEFVK